MNDRWLFLAAFGLLLLICAGMAIIQFRRPHSSASFTAVSSTPTSAMVATGSPQTAVGVPLQ
jgi:hypothetical protein